MRKIMPAVIVLGGIGWPSLASACPDCAAGVRAQVRQGIYGTNFGSNLAATVLPFGILLGITALIHSGFPAVRPNARPAASRSS